MKNRIVAGIVLSLGLFGGPRLVAQQVEVDEFTLDNGMTFLLVPREGDPNVASGWLAKVGSANERPGITGISHLFEHMMFKGTRVIGTKDIERDLAIIAELDEVKSLLRAEEGELIRKLRLGEISDLKDPANRSARHNELLKRFDELIAEQKKLIVKNEFDKIYTESGATSLNAATNEDQTFYFINVPANKLELWFWMESDRLANPVFREFYSERDVVHEERRLRTDSTPTGRFREEFDAMFWTSHPYGWPVVGWPSDLDGITRQEALDYFAINYAPNNLVACLVGDFDTEEAKRLARKYFGRLKRHEGQEPVRTREVEQLAEKRMIAYAETNPEVQIRYHSVADGHRDEPALVVLGSLLSGRTGRLYKSLVLDRQIANNAFAGQRGQKWAGYFAFAGVAKPGHTPEDVEQGIYDEIEKLKTEKVGDRELQKVKNQFAADNFRRIENNFFLMIQLLFYEANRGWEFFNEDPKRIEAVTADDVQRVANEYFKPEKRAVAIYYTKQAEAGEAETDPLLAGLNPQQRAQVKQFQAMLAQTPDEKASELLQRFESQSAEVPDEQRQFVEVIIKLLRAKLEGSGGGQ